MGRSWAVVPWLKGPLGKVQIDAVRPLAYVPVAAIMYRSRPLRSYPLVIQLWLN